MSKCEKMQALISQLLDGELTEDEAFEVRAHIAECDDCRAMYEAFTAVGAAVAAEEEVPADLHENIMSTVNAASKAQNGQRKFMQWRSMLTAAACLVVVVGTVFALGSTLFGRMGRSAKSDNAAPAAPATMGTAAYSQTSGSTAGGEAYAADDGYFTFTAADDCAAPESIECAPGEPAEADACRDEANGVQADLPAATEEPVAAGTGEPLVMTVLLFERIDDRTFAATVKECADNVFPVGETITLYLEDTAAAVGSLGTLPLTASVEYHSWGDGIAYVSGITIGR